MKPGLLVLACVKEITKKEIIISLPNGLNGFIKLTDVTEMIESISGSSSDVEEDESVSDTMVGIEIVTKDMIRSTVCLFGISPFFVTKRQFLLNKDYYLNPY